MIQKLLKGIVGFIKFIIFMTTGIFILILILVSLKYVQNLNADNFVNRNQLDDIESVTSFLEEAFPSSENIPVEDIIAFTEEQGIRCDWTQYHEAKTNFSGRIVCTTVVTNPEFYGVHGLPNKLLATIWDSITVDPPLIYIKFMIVRNSLQRVEARFFRLYL